MGIATSLARVFSCSFNDVNLQLDHQKHILKVTQFKDLRGVSIRPYKATHTWLNISKSQHLSRHKNIIPSKNNSIMMRVTYTK